MPQPSVRRAGLFAGLEQCSLPVAQGTPLHVVSDVLGHASIAITKDVYGHLLEGDKRAAAESMTRALSGGSSSPMAPSVAPKGTKKAPVR